MKDFLTSHLMLSAHLVVFACTLSIGAWMAHQSKEEVSISIQKNIDRQVILMTDLTEITARNGADEVVSEIISDCGRRNEFDVMLGNLNTLSPKELVTMQQLFESCGGFFAERKSLMVSRLEREYEVLADNVQLLKIVSKKDSDYVKLDAWKQLIELERTRSDGLTELTRIQKDIITQLISNKTDSEKNIQALVTQAQELTQSLTVMNKQVDILRNAINP